MDSMNRVTQAFEDLDRQRFYETLCRIQWERMVDEDALVAFGVDSIGVEDFLFRNESEN
jgi:hypothetical protein